MRLIDIISQTEKSKNTLSEIHNSIIEALDRLDSLYDSVEDEYAVNLLQEVMDILEAI